MDICQIDYAALANWIAALATVITAWIALRALNTWKQQKHYDLKIEALAYGRQALGYISYLRNSVSTSNEILEKYEEDYRNADKIGSSQRRFYLTFLSRREIMKDEFDTIIKIREKAWATFGEDHPITKFYDKIVKIDRELNKTHIENVNIDILKSSMSTDEWRKKIGQITRTLSLVGKEDEISKELDLLFNEMKKLREKLPK